MEFKWTTEEVSNHAGLQLKDTMFNLTTRPKVLLQVHLLIKFALLDGTAPGGAVALGEEVPLERDPVDEDALFRDAAAAAADFGVDDGALHGFVLANCLSY